MGRFFIASLNEGFFLCSNVDFIVILIGWLVEVDITSSVIFLEKLTFFLNLTLSFFDSVE